MSGFEVAGIVLGCVPLVIEGLKFYGDGLRTVHDVIKYQDIFDDFYLDFTTSLARLSQECENLYHKELHLPDHVLQEFFKDGGETWDDQFRLHFDQQVRTKIGKDYETYLKLFNSLRNYFDILRQKLGLDEQFQLPFVISSGSSKKIDEAKCAKFFSLWNRLRGALRKNRLEELTRKVQDRVERLCKLSNAAIALAPTRYQYAHPQSTNLSRSWLSVQSHVSQLYSALAHAWSHSCGASHAHEARFHLPQLGRELVDDESLNFLIVFSTDQTVSSVNPPTWSRRSVKILCKENINPASSPILGGAQQKQPSINIQPSTQYMTNICSSKNNVDDLCSAMGKPCQGNNCLGALVHQRRVYHFHDEACPNASLPRLKHIFARKQRAGLSQREKTSIAFALASAVLQLHDTPWMKALWDLDDLYLRTFDGHYQLVAIETFGLVSQQVAQRRPNIIENSPFYIKNRTVYSLAIALLELENGQPIAQCQSDDDLNDKGEVDMLTPFRTVDRLFKELQEDQEGFNFATAVGWCTNPKSDSITPSTSNSEYSLTNERFRKCFLEQVVLPLKEDYDSLPRR
ncbi:hypothetical protein C1H76_3827 [Elsinoe australis]|uniref:DUF7580 domain-containing protein n=1 Tax=Elsinoe australis TaxID=40998 RepID=A0A4U7AZN5_9PEZI|nr:hypothetical protein C1H76_3827 [Elsinoe australis]